MKHEIEIPDLPEGWEAVAYRVPVENEYFLSIDNEISHANDNSHWCPWLIIRKKQPRRIDEIEIPDLPEGWEADTLTFDKGQVEAMASRLTPEATACTLSCRIFIRKKQP